MAALMGMVNRMERAGRWVIISVAFYGFFIAAFALSGTFWLSWLMLAGAGASNIVSNVTRGTINQLITPDELRGRVTGVNSMFTSTGPQLGQFSAGTMAALMGNQTGPLVGGLFIVVLAAAV